MSATVFKEDKSEPAPVELVQPSDSELVIVSINGGTNQDSPDTLADRRGDSDGPPSTQPSPQQAQGEDDEDDTNGTESPVAPLIPDSQDNTVPHQEQRATHFCRKWGRKVLIIILAIVLSLLIIVGLTLIVGRTVLEPHFYNDIIAGHSKNEYTRTDLYALLTKFKCRVTAPCDVSEVRARASNSEPNQITINLTECNNVIYQDISEEPDFDFTLGGADRPLILIDENYMKQNYFAGNVTVSIEARALYSEDNDHTTTIVYICQFSNPNLFKSFKSQFSGQWEDLMDPDKAKCERVTVSEETNTSVSFTNSQTQLLFLGAVQTQELYSINLKYSLRGKTIIGLNESSLIHSCSMRVDKDDPTLPSECSITVSDELVNSAAGASLCVLGNGISAGDGTYVYTQVSIDLIKDNFLNEIRLTLTVLIPTTAVTILIDIVAIIIVIVWKRMSRPNYNQAHSESEPQPERSVISAISGQTFNPRSRVL